MKNINHRTAFGWAIAAMALFGPCQLFSIPTADASAGEKPYAVFLGAELKVLRDGEYCSIQTVTSDSYSIACKGKEVRVGMGHAQLKLEPALKITDSSATIENLISEPDYTPSNDPSLQLGISLSDAAGYSGDVSENKHSGHPFVAPQGVSGQVTTNIFNDGGEPKTGTGAWNDRTQEQRLYDAVSVSFLVSSPKPVRQPYVILVAHFHEKDKPHQPKNWVYAKKIDSFDSKPKKVKILQGGFPRGYELDKLTVHLYSGGVEMATNASENLVLLTREEAFQFLLADYVGSHKGVTAKPSLAMMNFSAEEKAHLRETKKPKFCFVEISQMGYPTAVFEDSGFTSKLKDGVLEGAIMKTRFFPALSSGAAVAGRATLHLNELANDDRS